MKGASLFVVVTLALAVTALPRVRRQFDWDNFEGPEDFDNNVNNIRIPRQRAPESWGRRNPNNWNQASGRQNFGAGNTGLDNTGFDNTGFDNTGFANSGFDNAGFDSTGFGNGVNNGVSTTTDPNTTTRASATYTNCMNVCQFTREYNPVCGTDGNTYSNRHELNCAARCGRVVLFVLSELTVVFSIQTGWKNLKEYKGFYRASKTSDFWYPGRPKEEFEDYKEELKDLSASNLNPDKRNIFQLKHTGPFGKNNFNRPDVDRFSNENRVFNKQGWPSNRPQILNTKIINNFNPYDYMVDRPITPRPELTTVAIPGMATTFSPCEQSCPSTMQFDAVCGDNGVTYSNLARFRCAVACGKRVRILHVGVCSIG